jgi:ArsR family transcriptional regulator, arsenate/arsenite/antimonite-responsive transcriptional repressor
MTNQPVNPVEFAKAIADDTRQHIMRLCCCEWLNVTEIVAALDQVSQPTVSHHLSILRVAGLVKVRREGKQVYYTLNQDRLASACCVLTDNFAPDHKLVVALQNE